MFIAIKRFRVAEGAEAAFEQVWMSRDTHLDKVPGFVEFHLLKGPEAAFSGPQAAAGMIEIEADAVLSKRS
jgi:heme-degrading monooxygenase HmoA